MFNLPQKVIQDIPKYRENLEKFLSGEMKEAFFRGIRVPWGNYSQRGGMFLMSRLRVPAGLLAPSQLRAIGEAAEKFADSKLHLTTRQDVQIHNVSYENSAKIIEYLANFNISPRGGGGNTVRNVTSCYLSGICPHENVEVHKTACGLTEYLLCIDDTYGLPRKLKIAFSGCEKDCDFTGINDIGFVAMKDGTFKVLCGGGMGAKCSVGRVLQEGVSRGDVGYVVRAVMNLFNKYGDRKNRNRNRLRFLIQDTGWERFVELYRQELKRTKDAEYIVLREEDEAGLPPADGQPSADIGQGDAGWDAFVQYNTGRQKQQGYHYVQIRIPFGEIDARTLTGLAEIAEISPAINFRTSRRQNLIISNVPSSMVYPVYKKLQGMLKDYLYPETLLDIVSCKASTTCNLGICNAIGMAPEIVKKLRKVQPGIDKLKDIRINVNGCLNACGHHPVGDVSFSGMARKVQGRTVPFYRVHMGGRPDAENTKLAQEAGVVPARAVPGLISDFVSSMPENTSVDVQAWISDGGRAVMEGLVRKYSYIPRYEEDRSYYVDFGRTDDFSLEGLSQGECGAGVIDMIESDIESAGASLTMAKENGFNPGEIKKAMLYSAGALLIVKGVDPKNETDTFVSFVKRFVDTGVCDPEFRSITGVYNAIVSGGGHGKEETWDYANRFYNEVKRIYSTMDSNFNFPVKEGAFPPGALSADVSVPDENVTPGPAPLIYDLRGTPCPINYVKTKIKLEELNTGDVLEVYLDDGEPIVNVPKSLEGDGHKILNIQRVDNYFKVAVKKER